MGDIFGRKARCLPLRLRDFSHFIARELRSYPGAAKIAWEEINREYNLQEQHPFLIKYIYQIFASVEGCFYSNWKNQDTVDELMHSVPPPETCERTDMIIAMAESSPHRDQSLIGIAEEMIMCQAYYWGDYLERLLQGICPDQHQFSAMALARSFSGYHQLLSEWTAFASTRLFFLRACPDSDHEESVPMVVSRTPVDLSHQQGWTRQGWIRLGEWYLGNVYFILDRESLLVRLENDPRGITCLRRCPMCPDLSADFQTIWCGKDYATSMQVRLPIAVNDLMARVNRTSRVKSARSADPAWD